MREERPDSSPTAFLSHSWEDHELAVRLAQDLRRAGIDVWLDEWEIQPGDSLRRRVDEGIGNASHFMVLLTTNSIRSEWVQVELDTGLVRRIQGLCRLIPILSKISSDLVPPTLQGIRWVRIDDYHSGFQELLDACYDLSWKPPLGSRPREFTLSPGWTSARGRPFAPFHTSVWGDAVEISAVTLAADPASYQLHIGTGPIVLRRVVRGSIYAVFGVRGAQHGCLVKIDVFDSSDGAYKARRFHQSVRLYHTDERERSYEEGLLFRTQSRVRDDMGPFIVELRHPTGIWQEGQYSVRICAVPVEEAHSLFLLMETDFVFFVEPDPSLF